MAGFVTVSPAVTQFTYYCCILGLASAIVFYLKFCCDESYSTFWLLIYNSILVLVILFYVGHWFVKPQCKYSPKNTVWRQSTLRRLAISSSFLI